MNKNVHNIRFVYIKLIIAAFMIFIGLKQSVNAAGFVGSGTQSDPYLIQDFEDFNYFFNSINDGNTYEGKYIEQTEDIHFPQEQVMYGMLYEKKFKGIFDGKGHAVYNIIEDFTNTGLFGTLDEGSVVKNWNLIGGQLICRNGIYTASLARRMYGGTVENFYSSVNITSQTASTKVCGVIGCIDTKGKLGNVIFDGTITSAGGDTYGVAGANSGPIIYENCKCTDNNVKIVVTGANSQGININNSKITPGNFATDNNINNFNLYSYLNGGIYYWKASDDGQKMVMDLDREISEGREFHLDGEGTVSNPYKINNLAEFRDFFNYLYEIESIVSNKAMFTNKYFVLTSDIDFEGEPLKGLTLNSVFSGIFDGKGHVVNNLQVSGNNVALFGAVTGENTQIKNFGISGGKVESLDGAYSATLVRRLAGGAKVLNCFSTADSVNISPIGESVSGIVGYIDVNGSVENCYYAGKVSTGDSLKMQDICGIAHGSANVDKVRVYNCIITSDCGTYNIVSNRLSAAEDNCSITSRIGLETNLNKLNTYVEDNAGLNYWEVKGNGVVAFSDRVSELKPNFDGHGTQEDPYLINTIEDFEEFQRLIKSNSQVDKASIAFLGKYFRQTDNLDFDGKVNLGLAIDNKFGGIYDGNGFVIKNANVQVANGSIFGSIDYGKVMNLGVIDSTIKLTSGTSGAAIVRRLYYGSVENCYSNATIIGCASTEGLSGLVGYLDVEGSVRNSYFAGTIDGTLSIQSNYTESAIVSGTGNTQTSTIVENCFWNSNVENGYYRIKTINDSREVTTEELSDGTLMALLNEYAETQDGYKYYIMDTTLNIPVQSSIGNVKAVFSNLSVDGYEDNLDETIDRIKWYQKGDTYYLFLPKLVDRAHLVPYFETKAGSTVTITDTQGNELGTLVSGQETNLFTNDEIIVNITGEGMKPTSEKIKVMQSTISSLFIELDGGDTSFTQINADKVHEVGFGGNAFITDDEGRVTTAKIKKMKGRGNATWEQVKKPYQLKFSKKISMLGMPEAQTWLLLTGYRDGTLIRTSTWFELCKDLNMNYTIDFKPADIYVNNNYLGTYLVTSKVEVDPNRVNISKTDEFLVEIDNNTDDFQFFTSKGYLITIKSPDLEGAEESVVTETKNNISKKLDLVESKLYDRSVPISEIAELIDLESFAKFYWIQEISENYDAMVGSCYLYEKNGKLHIGPPWDFDNSMNRSYTFTNPSVYYVLQDSGVNGRMKTNWYRELMARVEFSDLVDKIYLENKDAIENVPNIIDEQSEYIADSAAMNYIRWPYDEMKANQSTTWIANENSFEDAVGIFKTQVETRIQFYEKEYKDLVFENIEYSYTNKNGEKIVDTIALPQDERLLLQNTAEDAQISLVGITPEGTRRNLGTITLDEGIYEGDIKVSNNITKTTYKTANSATYSLDIVANKVEDIEIETLPEKLEYFEGEAPNVTGLKVNAVYTDETKVEITDYTVAPEILTIGEKIVIQYGDITKEIEVTIKENVVESVEIKTMPEKTVYIEGDEIDLTGLVIEAVYSNGERKEVENKDYTVTPESIDLDTTEITINYLELSAKIPVTVKANVIERIEVSKLPTKVDYIEGDTLDLNGIEVKAIYTNGKEEVVEGYTYEPTVPLTIDDTSVVVTYEDKTATIDITVIQNVIESVKLVGDVKADYFIGDAFDTSTFEVEATYTNGTKENIKEYEVTPKTISQDTEKVEIRVGSFVIEVPVTVKEDTIKELVILTAPEDKEYLPGEKYDISGIELKAVFESGKEEMVNLEDITIDPETITAETTEVTLAYGDKTVALPVRVRTYLKGDVNLDGKVNSTDAAIVLDRFTVNKWTSGELLRGDMDENGVLNSSDAALILQLF